MENYLITGGAGFIGSHFINNLLKTKRDINIVNVDKLTYAGSLTNIDYTDSRYTFIKADICNNDKIKNIVSRYNPQYVINFAAESHVDKSIQSSEAFVKTNILGTHILLEILKDVHINRYIQISTDEVYGPITKGNYDEEARVKPQNPYSASKASGDHLVMSFVNTYDFPGIITRCSNNYGPKQNYEKFIPKIIKYYIEGKKIPVYGNGLNIREWTYVNDHIKALEIILEKGQNGEIYNISSNIEMENISVVNKIIRYMDNNYRNSCFKEKKRYKYIEDRKGHDLRYSINCSKLCSLGWEPKTQFEEGLKKTIDWYIENKPWEIGG